MRNMTFQAALGLIVTTGLTITGCTTTQEAEAPPRQQPREEAPRLRLSENQMAFPTGDPSTSSILLEKVYPMEVTVNQPFDYTLKVTNLTRNTLDDVIVEDTLPRGWKMTAATPPAEASDDGVARWMIGSLGPEQTKMIRVTGAAGGEGTLTTCADVTYDSMLCSTIKVTQPAVKLVMTAAPEVTLCDAIPVKITVTNTGSGAARNIHVTEELPGGLAMSDGRTKFGFDIPVLEAGQFKEFPVTLKAGKTGRYESRAMLVADGGLKAESAVATTVVRQAMLAIDVTGREQSYIGRPVTYTITVGNNGDVAANDTIVENPMPMGTSFVNASDNGRHAGGMVVWNLGQLAPKASRKVTLTLNTPSIGEVRNTATARAACAAAVTDTADTYLEGIPAILLEVLDAHDPVQIGESTTYEIKTTNQGSSPGTNIKIVCELEDTMEFVSATGVTNAAQTGETITFAPLASLAPGAAATWRVTVRAVGEGDVRFSVKMNSEQLERSVDETEATNFYK